MIRRILQSQLLMLALSLTVMAAAQNVSLKFSGILGQSQPENSMPVAMGDCTGLVVDHAGSLWAVSADTIYHYTKTGAQWCATDRIKLPTWMEGSQQMCSRWDGERLYFGAGDKKLYQVSLTEKKVTPVMKFAATVKTFAVTPVGMTAGYAAKGKIFTLDGDTVNAFTADGAPLGPVLTITRPAGTKWTPQCLALVPENGDLLIGSYWPDSKIHRFGIDGKEVITDSWPRAYFAGHLLDIGKSVWALGYGGGAIDVMAPKDSACTIKAEWNMYTGALAEDQQGGYWLGTSQGVLYYDQNGTLIQRLGGITGSYLATATDGTLIAAGGGQMTRLSIADQPTAPFKNNANEPWQVGGGWNGRAAAICWDGKFFLVLDSGQRQLWQFDPWHTKWGEKPWIKVTEANAFTKPRLLACGDSLLWIVDDAKLLEGSCTNIADRHDITLPDAPAIPQVVALAAKDDETIFLAVPGGVSAYARDAQGNYRKKWEKTGMSKVSSVAYTLDTVLVADEGTRTITLLAAETGNVLGEMRADQIPNGMLPKYITASQRWVIVLDQAGSRILRCKLVTE
ncbi:MAG TPA: hypothetical protein VHV83_17050 [Armatimonadota bacterium]|nr:hypothetical protein [Armatimonadota bacterium]